MKDVRDRDDDRERDRERERDRDRERERDRENVANGEDRKGELPFRSRPLPSVEVDELL